MANVEPPPISKRVDSLASLSSWKQSLPAMLCNPCVTRRAFIAEFQDHNGKIRMFSAQVDNNRWPQIFGTSPWIREDSPAFAILRTLFAAIFVGHWIWNFVRYFDQGYWFIYLTSWSLTVETLYFVFAACCTWAAHLKLKSPKTEIIPDDKDIAIYLPWFVRVDWVLLHITMPAALLVVLLYWSLDNPFWNLKFTPDYLGFFVHGINFLLCMLDLLLGRNPFYLRHVLWFFVFIILYIIWTGVHFAAKVGMVDPCDDLANPDDGNYPQNECPIYGVLDWHSVTATGILAIIILFCVAPLCQFPLWWCVLKRRIIDRHVHQDVNQQPDQSESAVPPAGSNEDKYVIGDPV